MGHSKVTLNNFANAIAGAYVVENSVIVHKEIRYNFYISLCIDLANFINNQTRFLHITSYWYSVNLTVNYSVSRIISKIH